MAERKYTIILATVIGFFLAIGLVLLCILSLPQKR